ncbi:MAG TPA: hypothetical protein VFT29_18865 [Gemmatimonadaceae bacterium]|nr:hypothetical protein [Gemmatimonadaceae bacterium]
MATHWMQIAILTIVLTISGAVPGMAQSSQPKSDTYTWNGELESLDTTAKTMTVKSRVAYQEAISELKHFKGGDRVWIVWSGVHDSSDAVRQVRRSETGHKSDGNLVLPAELVSTEAPNQYLTFRVKVPESALAAIKTVKPGEWVTVTSRHQPSTEDDAVVSVRPYGANTTTE